MLSLNFCALRSNGTGFPLSSSAFAFAAAQLFFAGEPELRSSREKLFLFPGRKDILLHKAAHSTTGGRGSVFHAEGKRRKGPSCYSLPYGMATRILP